MNLNEFAQKILFGGDLESKLIEITDYSIDSSIRPVELPSLPARDHKIRISQDNQRFPKGHFHEVEKKAMALHSFANHELLAIEMMAAALLIYPDNTPELKKFKPKND